MQFYHNNKSDNF